MSQRSRNSHAASIVDVRWAKAQQHHLRVRILRYLLRHPTAHAAELAREWDESLGSLSYHMRHLEALGYIELARQTARRGAMTHHYRLVNRAEIALQLTRSRALPATTFGGPHAGQATAVLDARAMSDLQVLLERFLGDLAQLGAETHDRHPAGEARTPVALTVLMAVEDET